MTQTIREIAELLGDVTRWKYFPCPGETYSEAVVGWKGLKDEDTSYVFSVFQNLLSKHGRQDVTVRKTWIQRVHSYRAFAYSEMCAKVRINAPHVQRSLFGDNDDIEETNPPGTNQGGRNFGRGFPWRPK